MVMPTKSARSLQVEPLEFLFHDLDLVEVGIGKGGDHCQIEVVDVLALDSLDFEASRRDEKQFHGT